ncbi:hypothetical protein [Alteribacter populi]|uniref:hypothetical protein n=1 Tax=Alteribacter populi TaxID=2011011 RepID=UPI000BBAE8CD|nr:hypothetical protein [Alteribacter populi]
MRNFKVMFYCVALLLITVMVTGCGSESKGANNEEDESVADSETEDGSSDKEEDKSESTEKTDDSVKEESSKDSSKDAEKDESTDDSSNESENDKPNNDSSKSEEGSKGKDVDLSKYSSEEIEYARVWHQLAPNQQIDKMYVKKIPAGTPINPNHEDVSATYPEDVIQLKGTRVVDGAVTYSGNGDGTINVYEVPARWDEKLGGEVDKEAIKNTTENIVKNKKKVEIEPVANEEIINLIEKNEMDQ